MNSLDLVPTILIAGSQAFLSVLLELFHYVIALLLALHFSPTSACNKSCLLYILPLVELVQVKWLKLLLHMSYQVHEFQVLPLSSTSTHCTIILLLIALHIF